MAFNPKSLANLRPLDPSKANEYREKGLEVRRENKARRETFKAVAKDFEQLQKELPNLDALGVMRVAMLHYLEQDNLEDAMRIATLIAPYERPKMASVEQKITTNVADKSDAELLSLIQQAGILPSAVNLADDEGDT